MSEIINVPMSKQRDIKTVTAEIRTLTAQGQRLALEYAIEIGRRLKEAKSMLPHGEWGKWLKEEVEFSQSSANNFMRMFEEYGADQISIFGAEAKSQAIGNLPYTKALKLLAMPAEEREDFIRDTNVAEMSSRELEKAIREREAARLEAQAAKLELEEQRKKSLAAVQSERSLQEKLRQAQEDVRAADDQAVKKERELKEKLKEAEEALRKALTEKEAAEREAEKLHGSLEIPPEKLAALEKEAGQKAKEKFIAQAEKLKKQAEEAERAAQAAKENLEELRKQLAVASPETAQFKLLFEQVQGDFNRLTGLLLVIRKKDETSGEKLKRAMEALLEGMRQKL